MAKSNTTSSKKSRKSTTKKNVTIKSTSTEKTSNKSSKVKVNTQVTTNSKILRKHYLSFEKRLTINIILFIISFALCLFVAAKTIEKEKIAPINYTDVNNISYKVYLKNNEFYKQKYLDMNRAYVANLIDYIDIDFNYLFNIEKLTNMDFDYQVMAELIIENAKGTSFVDEKYVIKDIQTKKLENEGTLNLKENVIIDYSYYNLLANKFKNQTGVDIVSYLNVYLQVDKKTDEDLNYKISESTKSNIKIPLSERAIEINFDSNNKEQNKQVLPKGNIIFNPEYLAMEILLFFISCYFALKILKYLSTLVGVKTPYDKYVNKLLRDYDRLIVEVKTDLNKGNYNIIELTSFNELLDVRDNLKLPIIYFNIVKHEKGEFYIKNNLDIYRYVVKGIDLNK